MFNKTSGDARSSCHSLLNTLKGYATTLPAVILYYSTLTGSNRQVLTSKRYDKHHRHFYRGVPLPSPGQTLRERVCAIPSNNYLTSARDVAIRIILPFKHIRDQRMHCDINLVIFNSRKRKAYVRPVHKPQDQDKIKQFDMFDLLW